MLQETQKISKSTPPKKEKPQKPQPQKPKPQPKPKPRESIGKNGQPKRVRGTRAKIAFTVMRPVDPGMPAEITDEFETGYIPVLEMGKPMILNNAAPLQAAMKAVNRTGLTQLALRRAMPSGRTRYQFYYDGKQQSVKANADEYKENHEFYNENRITRKAHIKKGKSKTIGPRKRKSKKSMKGSETTNTASGTHRQSHLPEHLLDYDLTVE